ncbi:hypothetical protein EV193_11815 [Herbihabitans rhizosphaerae]|uniref:Uncharacterized protein n=1 Tax=Herbihabitans rhizosphaerae TaxID=1872711 RepID=A0A4V2ERA4_9PSEU|nr:hypothetical protein EV193_11815 [Herbihabitans rhizosphaerae]
MKVRDRIPIPGIPVTVAALDPTTVTLRITGGPGGQYGCSPCRMQSTDSGTTFTAAAGARVTVPTHVIDVLSFTPGGVMLRIGAK